MFGLILHGKAGLQSCAVVLVTCVSLWDPKLTSRAFKSRVFEEGGLPTHTRHLVCGALWVQQVDVNVAGASRPE